jgi:hypothetical protein
MMHRYLLDPDRARAYALLIERPNGTLRTWATALGWKTGKMQRFMASLSRYRLGEIVSDRNGTTFRPNTDSKVHRLASVCTDAYRSVSAPYLGSGSGLTASSSKPGYAGTPAKADQQPGAVRLIEAMNEILASNLGEHYRPVALDNFGSHRAARRWLVESAMPLEEALVLLRRHVGRFDLSKEKNGKPPISLGYFTKPMLREWAMLQREREQLALLPAIDMNVERVQPPQQPIDSQMIQTGEQPPASADSIVRGREEFLSLANSPLKPRRL